MDVGAVEVPTIRRSQTMQAITTVGLDIAKSVFQVHGVDAEGNVVCLQLKRRYVLLFFQKLPLHTCYLSACEVLRLSSRAKRLHRLDELATQDSNKQGAVNAIKAGEGIVDDNHGSGRLPSLMQRGMTIVITR